MASLDQKHVENFSRAFNSLLSNIELVMKGKKDRVATALICFCAGGHLLVEDDPGTGKTTLAKSLAASIEGNLRRIQFTPDMLPSDVTGSMVPDPDMPGQFKHREGPIFANIVLADEINRASPKTQAALLEAMEERQVTVEWTKPLPNPFFVIATQNSVEQSGTYELPEAQLDRFLMRTGIGYPEKPEHEVEMLTANIQGLRPDRLRGIMPASGTAQFSAEQMIRIAEHVAVSDAIKHYIVALVGKTRDLRDQGMGVRLPVSPRGSIALMRAARVVAAADERTFVTADDVKAVAQPVLAHRLLLTPEAEYSGRKAVDLIEGILEDVRTPTLQAG